MRAQEISRGACIRRKLLQRPGDAQARRLDRSRSDRSFALRKVIIERALWRPACLDNVVEAAGGIPSAPKQRHASVDDGLPVLGDCGHRGLRRYPPHYIDWSTSTQDAWPNSPQV